jgi:hypothetical protein
VTESRQEFLARVAEAHYSWVGDHLEDAPFDPESRVGSGDYNVWNLDMDGKADAQDAFMQAVGDVPEDLVDDSMPQEDLPQEPQEPAPDTTG